MNKVYAYVNDDSDIIIVADGVEHAFDGATAVMDCTAPSFCTHCGAEGPVVEPDARNYRCEVCGSDSVSSILDIAGII